MPNIRPRIGAFVVSFLSKGNREQGSELLVPRLFENSNSIWRDWLGHGDPDYCAC